MKLFLVYYYEIVSLVRCVCLKFKWIKYLLVFNFLLVVKIFYIFRSVVLFKEFILKRMLIECEGVEKVY